LSPARPAVPVLMSSCSPSGTFGPALRPGSTVPLIERDLRPASPTISRPVELSPRLSFVSSVFPHAFYRDGQGRTRAADVRGGAIIGGGSLALAALLRPALLRLGPARHLVPAARRGPRLPGSATGSTRKEPVRRLARELTRLGTRDLEALGRSCGTRRLARAPQLRLRGSAILLARCRRRTR